MYGVEICDFIFKASEGTYKLNRQTMYSALQRLRKKKLISMRFENSPLGGDRHYYRLTDLGLGLLADKKLDWQNSKAVIDTIVFDKVEIQLPTVDAVIASDAVIANEVVVASLRGNEVAEATPPVERIVVASTIQEISPLKEYVLSTGGEYITVPLGGDTRIASQSIPVTLNPLQEYPAPQRVERPAKQPPRQMAMDMSYMVAVHPFVKHAGTRKSGKFVLYNRLRIVCAAMVCSLVALGLLCTTLFLKPAYSPEERSFLAVGWVCLAVYLLFNIILYSAYPKYKRIVASRGSDIARRSIITACIAVAATSICLMTGLSAVTASDFLVYWIVPCVIGSAFLLEGLAILALKKRPFFLT